MEYSKIIAVTGLPGLQELISTKNDGAIVRSLEDNSTRFVSSRIHNFSHLESIEIYTIRDNVNLVEIFQSMEKAGGSLPDDKDAKAVKSYFEKAFPDMDFERVYNSDMKKIVKWYSILKSKNVEMTLSEVPEEEEVEEEVVVAPVKEEKAASKPKAKAADKEEEAPKKTAKKAAKKEKTEEEEAPKKKAAPKAKKEASEKEETPKKKSAPKKK